MVTNKISKIFNNAKPMLLYIKLFDLILRIPTYLYYLESRWLEY